VGSRFATTAVLGFAVTSRAVAFLGRRGVVCTFVAAHLALGGAAALGAGSDRSAVPSRQTVDPSHATCWHRATRTVQPCDDRDQARAEVIEPVTALFRGRDYDQLAVMFDRWCTADLRLANGDWRVAYFGRGILVGMVESKDWAGRLEEIRRWRQGRPESAAAAFIDTVAHRAWAWEVRAFFLAKAIPEQLRSEFLVRTRAAQARLDLAPAIRDTCPASATLRLSLLVDADAPHAAVEAMAAELTGRFPDYPEIWFTYARGDDPSAGGSVDAYLSAVRRAISFVPQDRSDALGVRMLWPLLDRREEQIGWGDPKRVIDWPRVYAGIRALEQSHPNSLSVRMRNIRIACVGPDHDAYRKVRDPFDGAEDVLVGLLGSLPFCDARHDWRGVQRPVQPR
jgi:hypothetical protein